MRTPRLPLTSSFVPILALSTVAFAVACGEDFSTGDEGPPPGTANVTYWAESTGDVTFTRLTFRANGEQTRRGAFGGFSTTRVVPFGAQISISADATVNSSGRAEIGMRASGNGASVDETASRSSTKPVSFTLTVPPKPVQ